MLTRVPFRVTERAELLKADVLQTGLLFQLTACGIFQRLSNDSETAGQRPLPLEGLAPALNEQDLYPFVIKTENDAIGGLAYL